MYETFAEKMSEDKVDSIDKVDTIDYDSEDNKDEYEDASEGPNGFVKPSEWESKSETKDQKKLDDASETPEETVNKDSLGHEENSPDFIDEDVLQSWETGDSCLSESQLEQKRLEAAQYKLEGNALYTESKTREACGKTSSFLKKHLHLTLIFQ